MDSQQNYSAILLWRTKIIKTSSSVFIENRFIYSIYSDCHFSSPILCISSIFPIQINTLSFSLSLKNKQTYRKIKENKIKKLKVKNKHKKEPKKSHKKYINIQRHTFSLREIPLNTRSESSKYAWKTGKEKNLPKKPLSSFFFCELHYEIRPKHNKTDTHTNSKILWLPWAGSAGV